MNVFPGKGQAMWYDNICCKVRMLIIPHFIPALDGTQGNTGEPAAGKSELMLANTGFHKIEIIRICKMHECKHHQQYFYVLNSEMFFLVNEVNNFINISPVSQNLKYLESSPYNIGIREA